MSDLTEERPNIVNYLGNTCGKYYLITWEERIYKKTSTGVLQTKVNNHKSLKVQGSC